MSMGRIIAVLLVVAAFAVGMQVGKKSGGEPVVTSSSGGASYGGSASGEAAADGPATEANVTEARKLIKKGSSRFVAGPPMSDVVVTVEDGQSIQEAVKAAELAIKLERLIAGEPSEHAHTTVEEVTRREIESLVVSEDEVEDDDEESVEDPGPAAR